MKELVKKSEGKIKYRHLYQKPEKESANVNAFGTGVCQLYNVLCRMKPPAHLHCVILTFVGSVPTSNYRVVITEGAMELSVNIMY